MLFEILGAGRPAAGTRDDKAKFRRGDHGERILHDIGKVGTSPRDSMASSARVPMNARLPSFCKRRITRSTTSCWRSIPRKIVVLLRRHCPAG